MNSTTIFVCTVAFVFSFSAYGQGYSSYYYDYKLLNPALAGSKDKHIFTTVYAGVPSSEYFSLYYGTYETSIPAIKSGVGALLLYDEFGIQKRFRAGVFYSKQFSFNEHSGLRLGTQLSFRRRELDYDQLESSDQEDPVFASGDNVTKKFNVDLGLQYYSRIVNIGIGVRELLKEEGEDISIWSLIVSREFNVGSALKVTPSVVYMTNRDDSRFDINSIFEIKKWILVGGGYVMIDGDDDLTFTAGLNFNDWVQVIGHVYSSANYRLRDFMDPKMEIMVRANIPSSFKK